MEIAYYPGCTLHASSELYDIQSRLVLGKLGLELKEIEDWNCCGATSASKTDDFLAVALPARNLGIADASGYPEIVIPCSSCLSRMLVSQRRLAEDPELKDVINAELEKKVEGSIKIRSILEVLLPKARSGEIAEKAQIKLEGLKPVCYYGCLLTRFPCDMEVPDNVENPQGMETICKALGAQPLDWGYKTDCCGAAASVNDTDTSLFLMSKILKDAVARGANCFVTTCPMCQFNMDAYQDQVGEKYGIPERLPVYFITELIGVSLGLSPQEMQIDRHFVDAMGLLKELKLI
ncbi:MAG: CoB--CoM heterodisulfide reductase iron-sulfur subunit B family protein [Alphaproteobacteria bacterium]|uniref:CoB--CoM heterodisulfide reductase iron-sulfur subunit B family protein n=1 Tax=Candidatus Nitrobium versatile TaxID=2884831 RepID=A0A953JCE9_9BACT|nr:CoB--CoM heterodisulfide reductase iron-sulfur subunit B family protein [Candidatus Nitrobium versatile]